MATPVTAPLSLTQKLRERLILLHGERVATSDRDPLRGHIRLFMELRSKDYGADGKRCKEGIASSKIGCERESGGQLTL